jgi:outer membrane usher protein
MNSLMALRIRLLFIPFLSRLLLLVMAWHQVSYAIQPSPIDTENTNQTEYHALVDGLSDAGYIMPTRQEVIAPLLINGQLQGEINVIIADSQIHSTLDIRPLNTLLAPFVSARFLRQLADRMVSSNILSFNDLSGMGLHLTFDVEHVLLRATLDPMIRKPQLFDLQTHQQKQDDSQAIPNAQVSGALDYFISGGWLNDERQAVDLEFDGHINIKNWVLQNRHSYLENKTSHWQRRQTLLTYDWPEKLARFSGGDLNYQRIGFMGSQQISGFSYGTLFELQPQLVSSPLSAEEFFLEQDSRVEVFIDGQLSDRRNLTAGQHNIYDLPLIDGVNQVELKITDVLGRQQTVVFFETQDQRLLNPGLSEYSISMGVPRSSGLDGIEYRENNPMLSTFYRYGWYEDITLGSWLEISEDVFGIGLTGITNQVYGAFTGELAFSSSHGANKEVAPAIRLGYRYRTRNWTFDSEWNWQDAQFATLGQGPEANNSHHQARIGITFPHLGPWSTSLSIAHSRQWQGDNRFSKRLSLTRELAKDWRLSVNFAHFNTQSDQESFIGMQFYWDPSGSRHQANGSFNSDNHASSTEYNYRREGELGFDYRAGLRENDTGNQQRADINYVSPKLTSRFAVNHDNFSAGTSHNTQSFAFGSALGFADGQWSASRPLLGQPFAIISGMSSLSDAKIGIVRGAGVQATAFLDGAGDTSIMPGLSAYYVNRLNLDLQDLPIEMQIREEQFKVKPTYRSAVVLFVGAEGRAYITATLLNPLGQPIIHKVIKVFPLSGADPILVFTDETGLTVVEGLDAGDYQILVPGAKVLSARFSVPEGIQGKLSLGSLTLTEKEK